ncbi:acetolactate synthase 2 small subunit [Serratia rhizosphaerae]|uniref:Acetolactate synthase 2 small subunit n=1 Tax=Serratia rhizosphaerae TaxID=2597702 RepID=A0ABX6GMC9_9GAMM|nr:MULTISPECIES: acetolactate synthase 2 small subunit [Serratia]MBU3894055.1 acetolactate synthase 2 small subunit [Serratia rubidaea]HAU96866.1 acetolactate synthase 2 small subunit [Serratia marcescens]AVJ19775.1 acetolactate synthase 2 small subunit [Serratia sp. MYb239]MCA4823327.1 acetolactate synthase 2 small subunit [Serratia rubidaea]MEB6337484.1 acetolactate synthase 2 small subunit [Serratia rhizosphaerae]
MMQHQLSIQARFRPEMLERVLRVVRHRGFQVCAMNMASGLNSDRVNIELTVASQRSVDLLSSQLNKLMDVSCVEIQQHNNTSQQIRA